MIVCSCNALSEARIKAALAGPHPPTRVLEVHHHLGCRPQCGCCARNILGLIRQAQCHAKCQAQCLDSTGASEASLRDDVAA